MLAVIVNELVVDFPRSTHPSGSYGPRDLVQAITDHCGSGKYHARDVQRRLDFAGKHEDVDAR